MVITNPILQLKKVSISYTPGKNAVEEVSADIAEKKITAIMGPSGCGKPCIDCYFVSSSSAGSRGSSEDPSRWSGRAALMPKAIATPTTVSMMRAAA